MAVAQIKAAIPIKQNANGVYLVGNTRVTLDTVVRAHERGLSAAEITRRYPALQLNDVYLVLGYYLNNQARVERYLQDRKKYAEHMRKVNESRFPQNGIRARLVARTRKK